MNKSNGSGKSRTYYNKGKFNLSGGVIVMKPKDINNIKYLYYYLNYNNHLVEKYYFEQDKKNLNISDLLKIDIPLPSLENQHKIIKEIETIESEQSSYANLTKALQEHIDRINTSIKNICTIKQLLNNTNDNSDN